MVVKYFFRFIIVSEVLQKQLNPTHCLPISLQILGLLSLLLMPTFWRYSR